MMALRRPAVTFFGLALLNAAAHGAAQPLPANVTFADQRIEAVAISLMVASKTVRTLFAELRLANDVTVRITRPADPSSDVSKTLVRVRPYDTGAIDVTIELAEGAPSETLGHQLAHVLEFLDRRDPILGLTDATNRTFDDPATPFDSTRAVETAQIVRREVEMAPPVIRALLAAATGPGAAARQPSIRARKEAMRKVPPRRVRP
jgi:hypothetical protein